MILRVRLCGLRGVLVGVMIVPGRKVRLVARLVVIPRFMALGGFAVMASRVLVVIGCLVMMLGGYFRHSLTSVGTLPLRNDGDMTDDEREGPGSNMRQNRDSTEW